jgi:hypothetical protein
MSSTLSINITSDLSQEQLNSALAAADLGKYEQLQAIMNYLRSAESGAGAATLALQYGPTVKASGTLTLDTVIATDAVNVAGQTLTAVASSPTASQFEVGADDEETAANLAAAINSNVTTSASVVATANGVVVTIVALTAGVAGNSIVLTSADSTIVASGSGTLAGGLAGISKTLAFNR